LIDDWDEHPSSVPVDLIISTFAGEQKSEKVPDNQHFPPFREVEERQGEVRPGKAGPALIPGGGLVMGTLKSIIAVHDGGLDRRNTSRFRQTGLFARWRRAVARWFRCMGREVGHAGVEWTTSWLQMARRVQPIPVVAATRFPAMNRSNPRGKVVRI
jgi:hypothetical protein